MLNSEYGLIKPACPHRHTVQHAGREAGAGDLREDWEAVADRVRQRLPCSEPACRPVSRLSICACVM